MRYLGGKASIAKEVAGYLESVRPHGAFYWEPFVGGANVLRRMSGERGASDACEPLITMYAALQRGWQPPTEVTAETFNDYKARRPAGDPNTAFIGFGCAFRGIYFSTFMSNSGRTTVEDGYNPAKGQARVLQETIAECRNVTFACMDYREAEPAGCLIYADPPYAGTTGYEGTGAFDSGEFFDWARRVSLRNVLVISEYAAPDDFVCVREFRKYHRCGNNGHRIERLFRWRGGVS